MHMLPAATVTTAIARKLGWDGTIPISIVLMLQARGVHQSRTPVVIPVTTHGALMVVVSIKPLYVLMAHVYLAAPRLVEGLEVGVLLFRAGELLLAMAVQTLH